MNNIPDLIWVSHDPYISFLHNSVQASKQHLTNTLKHIKRKSPQHIKTNILFNYNVGLPMQSTDRYDLSHQVI